MDAFDLNKVFEKFPWDKNIPDWNDPSLSYTDESHFLFKRTESIKNGVIHKIDRHAFGDILFGIKNKESFDITVYIHSDGFEQYCNRPLETIDIKSGELAHFAIPFLMANLYQRKAIYIKVTNAGDVASTRLWNYLFGSIHKIELIYGIVPSPLRTLMMTTPYVFHAEKDICVYAGGALYTWLEAFGWAHLETLVNLEFWNAYLAHLIPTDELYSNFINKHPHIIELPKECFVYKDNYKKIEQVKAFIHLPIKMMRKNQISMYL